jgi:hypothetical protein
VNIVPVWLLIVPSPFGVLPFGKVTFIAFELAAAAAAGITEAAAMAAPVVRNSRRVACTFSILMICSFGLCSRVTSTTPPLIVSTLRQLSTQLVALQS